jgi:hypothetical protein
MYSSPGRPQIDETTRRQLLDNYLRNQQTQSSIAPSVPSVAAFNVSGGVAGSTFHPSLFQTVHSVQNDDRSETFSDISRRSVMTSPMLGMGNSNIVQVNQVIAPTVSVSGDLSIVPVAELPENISIEDFSNLVKKWIEIDNWIKKSQELAKQKRKQKDKLSEIITHYMTRYNIEDLNTSEGKIRCKVRFVKSGVNQKVVKEKIAELLKDNEETCNTLITKIFDEREKVEKVSLRRIKIT